MDNGALHDDPTPSRLVDALRAYGDHRGDDTRWQVVAAAEHPLRSADSNTARRLEETLREVFAGRVVDDATLTTVAFLERQLRPTGEPRANGVAHLDDTAWPPGTSPEARAAAVARGYIGPQAGEYATAVDRKVRDLQAAEDARTIKRGDVEGEGIQVADVAAVVEAIRNGEAGGELPTLYARTDRQPLLYAGYTHSFFGESESYKSMAAQAACAWALGAGLTCAYLDLEDRAEGVIDRLLRLGADDRRLAERFFYARLDGPTTDAQRAELYRRCEELQWSIVIVDGVTEAMAAHGLKPNDMDDVATLYRLLLTPFANLGAAAVTVDHYSKDAETKGQIGSQHKRAGITGATFRFDRHRDGLAKVTVDKDRRHGVRAIALGGVVGWLHVEGGVGEALDVRLEPSAGRAARPTMLMERLSRTVEDANRDGLLPTSAWATKHTGGSETAKRDALRYLIDEGFVVREVVGRGFGHRSARPYREDGPQRPVPETRPRADLD